LLTSTQKVLYSAILNKEKATVVWATVTQRRSTDPSELMERNAYIFEKVQRHSMEILTESTFTDRTQYVLRPLPSNFGSGQ
jgi:hypothetical protein